VGTGRPALSGRSADARPVREPGQGGHYGSAVSRRAPVDAAPDAGSGIPRGARPAWNPDSVPVYRGGSLTSPREPAGPDAPDAAHPGVPRRAYDGAPGSSRRSGVPPPASAGPGSSDPGRAVPRGGPLSYGPQEDPRSTGQRRPSHEPPVYNPPGPHGGQRERGGAGPPYREAPGSASAPPPTAAPRQAPDGGGSRVAVPRSGGDQPRGGAAPPPSRAPAAGAPPSRRR
jgi:hypothetical protein